MVGNGQMKFTHICPLQVLSLVRQLVKLGYYGDSERMRALLLPLLQLIDGRNDAPFDVSKGQLPVLNYF